MDQLKKLFASLTLPQKIGLALALLAVGVGVPMFTHWQKESDFKPLFTNMAPEDAAAVLQKLKESGVDHRLADNGRLFIDFLVHEMPELAFVGCGRCQGCRLDRTFYFLALFVVECCTAWLKDGHVAVFKLGDLGCEGRKGNSV